MGNEDEEDKDESVGWSFNMLMANKIDKADGLMIIALNAVRVHHKLAGIGYDEATKLDVMHEIKFVVMTVGLPIGIVFDENEECCWIGRIFEYGNAATNARGDKIKIGDQLASINGNSTYGKKVAEVCRVLAAAPNSKDIEFTFMRYIGPLRPILRQVEQQGYEIIDPILSKEDDDTTTDVHSVQPPHASPVCI